MENKMKLSLTIITAITVSGWALALVYAITNSYNISIRDFGGMLIAGLFFGLLLNIVLSISTVCVWKGIK